MEKELISKYLNNQCTESELNEVLGWVKTDDVLNEEEKKWSFEIWDSWIESDNVGEDENFIVLFDKIQKKIGRNKLPDKANKSKTLSIIFTWATRAAAFLLIPVLAFLVYTLSENRNKFAKYDALASDSLEVIAPIGSKTIVQLSDGTEVHLNYGSKIKYPHFFSDNTRDVTLSGEGFFKVTHDPQKPFIVKAKNLKIKAIGTTFNVLAYPDKDVVETTLVSGKVILEQVKKGGEIINIGSMKPGLHVNYNLKSGSVSRTEENIEKYISWIDGKLIFENTPILQVIEKLSIMFNVDFEVKDEIKGYKYTVTLTDDPLYQILDLMTIATPISYRTLPRKKLPDGTYSRQRIILEKR
jgi:transmembrane sensor